MKEITRWQWVKLWFCNRREYAFMLITEPLRQEIMRRERQHRPVKQIYKEIRGLRNIFMRIV